MPVEGQFSKRYYLDDMGMFVTLKQTKEVKDCIR